MNTEHDAPYKRGFYEGSRGLPITLYAKQEDQNEYERGRRDGIDALNDLRREARAKRTEKRCPTTIHKPR